jgi:hypothetical protein
MRVFGLTLGRSARPSRPNGCVSCSTGISVARAETDWAPSVIELWDCGGSGWYCVPDGARDGWHRRSVITANGTADGFHPIGGPTTIMAYGLPIADRGSRPTGSAARSPTGSWGNP